MAEQGRPSKLDKALAGVQSAAEDEARANIRARTNGRAGQVREVLEAAADDGRHVYDARTRTFVFVEPGLHDPRFEASQQRARWHTPGSLAMVEVFGHSEIARNLGAIVDVAVAFALEQQKAFEADEAEHRRLKDAEIRELGDRLVEGEVDGGPLYDQQEAGEIEPVSTGEEV